MLRDIPRIYLLLFGFVVVLVGLVFWYKVYFERGYDVLQLNEIILTNAVSEVDQTSRIHEGVMMLSNTFETKMWETLEDVYEDESVVEFDYLFDQSDDRFTDVEERGSSGMYVIGSDNNNEKPQMNQSDHFTKKPVQAIRVKVKAKGDGVGEWSYVGSVRVDVASNQ